MRATRVLVDFIANTTFDDLSPAAVHATKRLILDELGCALGAAATDLGRVAIGLAADFGRGNEATVLGAGEKGSVLGAGYVNGRLANLLDADETFMMQGHHGHATVAAALALCEREGRSGRDLLTAAAVGFEVGARTGLAHTTGLDIKDGRVISWGILGGPAMAVFGSAAAACQVLGLDADRVGHALGIAAAQCPLKAAGKWSEPEALPTIKYNDSGFAGLAGLTGAQLAARGVTGVPDVFDGANGWWRTYGVPEPPRLEQFADGLRQRWMVVETSYKPWPCCRYLHVALTGFEQILQAEGLQPDEIDRVVLATHPAVCDRPSFRQQGPLRDLVCGSFSYPHAAAMIAFGVASGPRWFDPEIINRADVQGFRKKVFTDFEPDSFIPDRWLRDDEFGRIPSSATVTARGRTYRRAPLYAKGDPWSSETALSDEALVAKFRSMALPLRPGSATWEAQVERIADAVFRLDELPRVDELTGQLMASGLQPSAISS